MWRDYTRRVPRGCLAPAGHPEAWLFVTWMPYSNTVAIEGHGDENLLYSYRLQSIATQINAREKANSQKAAPSCTELLLFRRFSTANHP